MLPRRLPRARLLVRRVSFACCPDEQASSLRGSSNPGALGRCFLAVGVMGQVATNGADVIWHSEREVMQGVQRVIADVAYDDCAVCRRTDELQAQAVGCNAAFCAIQMHVLERQVLKAS